MDYIPSDGVIVLDSGSLRSWEYQRGQFNLAFMPGQSYDFRVGVLEDHLPSFGAWVDEMSRLLTHVRFCCPHLADGDVLVGHVAALEELYDSLEDAYESGNWDLDKISALVAWVNSSAPTVGLSSVLEVR